MAGVVVAQGNVDNRNYGIDALRLYSMFLVVVLHVLGKGGILENSIGVTNKVAWFLEISAYCAVDCFALISGYVGCKPKDKPNRTSKYISMWAQAFFYSFGISFIAFFAFRDLVTVKQLVLSLFPVSTNQYWYFSSYTALFVFMPLFNKIISNMEDKELTVYVLLTVLLFSFLGIFAHFLGGDPFVLNRGYSTPWIIALYFLGAWISRVNLNDKISTKLAVVLMLSGIIFTWFYQFFLVRIVKTGSFVTYNSPTILLVAMCIMIIFLNKKFCNTSIRIIKMFSPAAFGVYLLHQQWVIFENIFPKYFVRFATVPFWQLPVIVLAIAFFVFLFCLIIEKMRIACFKALRLHKLFDFLGNKAEILFNRITNRIINYLMG